VTGVTFYSNRRSLTAPQMTQPQGAKSEVLPANRYFILFFQDDRASIPDLTKQYLDAARYVKRWVDERMQANDYVAVVSYTARLWIWHDFTADKAEVKGAIDNFLAGKRRDALTTWPSRMPDAPGGPSLLAGLPSGRELKRETRKIYFGLQAVADATANIPGRKNILMYSIGFGDVREFGIWTPDPRYYDDMKEALNEHNVAVHTIDLIPTTEQGSLTDRILNQSLSQLAQDTGGEYFYHFADFGFPVQQVGENEGGYYMVSFKSEHPKGQDGYRTVKVDTTNPRLEVRTREGYHYGAPSEPAALSAAPDA